MGLSSSTPIDEASEHEALSFVWHPYPEGLTLPELRTRLRPGAQTIPRCPWVRRPVPTTPSSATRRGRHVLDLRQAGSRHRWPRRARQSGRSRRSPPPSPQALQLGTWEPVANRRGLVRLREDADARGGAAPVTATASATACRSMPRDAELEDPVDGPYVGLCGVPFPPNSTVVPDHGCRHHLPRVGRRSSGSDSRGSRCAKRRSPPSRSEHAGGGVNTARQLPASTQAPLAHTPTKLSGLGIGDSG